MDCGTLLSEDLWVCRPPAVPAIPSPDSVDWVFSPAPAPLAWRSGSGADWLPKHTVRADEQGWGHLHTFRRNCKRARLCMYSGYAQQIWHVGAHLSHLCSVSGLLSSCSPHPLSPFVYLSRASVSLLENKTCK